MKPRSTVAVVLLAAVAWYTISFVDGRNPSVPDTGPVTGVLSWLPPPLAAKFTTALTWATDHIVVVGGLLFLILLVVVVRAIRARMPVAQDPQRLYTSGQRAESFARAGGRCEYTGFLLFRCAKPAEHADHLYPWSRGGATSLANCVAACQRCNLSKGAKILPAWRVKLLVRRRRRYYPPGVDTAVGQKYAQRVTAG